MKSDKSICYYVDKVSTKHLILFESYLRLKPSCCLKPVLCTFTGILLLELFGWKLINCYIYTNRCPMRIWEQQAKTIVPTRNFTDGYAHANGKKMIFTINWKPKRPNWRNYNSCMWSSALFTCQTKYVYWNNSHWIWSYENETEKVYQLTTDYKDKTQKIAYESEKLNDDRLKVLNEIDELQKKMNEAYSERDQLQKKLTKQVNTAFRDGMWVLGSRKSFGC